MAMYSMLPSWRISVRGMKPQTTWPRSGRASHSSTANAPAIARINPTTSASTYRKPRCCRRQHEQHVERRDDHAPDQRQAEQQVRGDRRAEHFGEVAGRDGDLADQPERNGRRTRVAVPAGLREVPAARDPEARSERLQDDRHHVGQNDDAEERVSVPGASGEVGRPVARVHVPDGDEIAGSRKCEELAPESRAHRHVDRAVDLGQALGGQREAPPRPERGRPGLLVHRGEKFDA